MISPACAHARAGKNATAATRKAPSNSSSNVITRRYERDLALEDHGEAFRIAVRVLGAVGHVGRGIVFALVGWFLFRAALDHDPNEGGGLDTALKQLVRSERGAGLLRLVAVALFAFGLYRITDGFVRRRDGLANA